MEEIVSLLCLLVQRVIRTEATSRYLMILMGLHLDPILVRHWHLQLQTEKIGHIINITDIG